MDKLISISMSMILALSLYIGAKIMTDLNDGRIQTVVKQLTNNKAYAGAK